MESGRRGGPDVEIPTFSVRLAINDKTTRYLGKQVLVRTDDHGADVVVVVGGQARTTARVRGFHEPKPGEAVIEKVFPLAELDTAIELP